MNYWISTKKELPEVIQVSRWARESKPVLVKDENGNYAVCLYTNEFDGSDGGWILPVAKFAKIGHPTDLLVSFDILEWKYIS
jgi:hypothetical protein